jgi:hypothetical protein
VTGPLDLRGSCRAFLAPGDLRGNTALSKLETNHPELSLESEDPGRPPVQRLVQQLLLGRLDGLDGHAVAAFLSGWSSAVDLIRRTDLTMPDASPEVVDAIRRLVSAIEQAQRATLADADD